MSPARSKAFAILERVERGAFASDLLREATDLDARDAALASTIVFGCLRFRAQLDFLIETLSGRPAEKLDSEVRTALRMGIYQLRCLDRVPSYAAVGESVDLVKRAGKRSAAGLVNALLRKVNREPVTWPDRATELSIPAWMLERWDRQCGRGTADGIARAFLSPPETYVRVPPGQSVDSSSLEPTDVPGCYRATGEPPAGLRQQDIGSQSIVPLLDLRPGLMFLDLCAAPGNKTAQALESGVLAVACDVSPARLTGLRPLPCDLVVLDAARSLPFCRCFDRILLDVPCSGTGTLGRNPEIKWRVQPADFMAFHDRQVQMLRNALELLTPGGVLVYSTCSLEPEENEQVVEEVLVRRPETVLRRIPGRDPGDGFFAAVLRSG